MRQSAPPSAPPSAKDTKQGEFQFTEYWEGKTGLAFGITDVLFSQKTPYQRVQVWETDAFGRLLTLDGLVMLTERDEFVYHEMLSHPALCLAPGIRRVLVVGGGDGGVVREVLRHKGVEHVDLVEIDEVVIEASRRFFPSVSCRLDDPHVSIRVADATAFVAAAPSGSYDLILVDSTDPVGIAEGLFGGSFYENCARLLSAEGILVAQMDSPFERFFQETVAGALRVLRPLFPVVASYLAHIPTYPTGTWSFTLASRHRHPVEDYDWGRAAAQLAAFGQRLRYYNPDVHLAAFALPNFVQDVLGE